MSASEISTEIDEVFGLEEVLEAAIREKYVFDDATQDLIAKLRQRVDILLDRCYSGENFQVAYELWRRTKPEEYIRTTYSRFRDDLPDRRVDWGDEVDVLLSISSRMSRFFAKYKFGLKTAFGDHRRTSMGSMFVNDCISIARNRFRASVRRNQMYDTRTLHSAFDLAVETIRPEFAVTFPYEELIQWLEDVNARIPDTFTMKEGEILRILYENPDKLLAKKTISRRYGLVFSDAVKCVRGLARKTKSFLATRSNL